MERIQSNITAKTECEEERNRNGIKYGLDDVLSSSSSFACKERVNTQMNGVHRDCSGDTTRVPNPPSLSLPNNI